MTSYSVISSDDHVFEPPDLWTSRIEPKFRDRAPHIITKEEGDFWSCDGVQMTSPAPGAQAGLRFDEPEKLTNKDVFENVRPGGYIPEEHVKDLDIDGVDVSITYPTLGLVLYSIPDSELLSAIFRTYNDWLADFCKPFPKRLYGIGMINIDDVQSGIKELERCAKMGLVGAVIPVYPPQSRQYDSPEYDPLWAAAQDLDIPISLHIGTNRLGQDPEYLHENVWTVAYQANREHWAKMSLSHMVLTGVFERYPKLKVGSVEHELAWVPHFMSRLDYHYTQTAMGVNGYRYKENMLPSDYFHRNVFLGFQEDARGIEDRYIIGVDQLQWGSDYPHQESTFPRSRQILDEILVDCTEEERAKIAGGNAARVYHLS